MSKMKDLALLLQEKKSNVLLVEEAIIEHYADPIDIELEFYRWAKKQPFDIDDNNYEDFLDLFLEGKIKTREWIECLGNYYHHADIAYAFELYNLDKKNKIEDPYGELEF